jgi:hypothetical protein
VVEFSKCVDNLLRVVNPLLGESAASARLAIRFPSAFAVIRNTIQLFAECLAVETVSKPGLAVTD